MDICEDELHFLGECPAYNEQRMHFILEVKDRMDKYEIKMQGKPLEDIVIRQWTQENNSRVNLTGIYRLFMAVMKDEESVDIPKGLFQKIAHLFYSYLNECWIRRLKLLENDELVEQAMRSAYDSSNIAPGEIENRIAAGVISRSNSASKKKDDEAAKKRLKIEKNSFYIGTWIRHDQNECECMQVGRVVEAVSTGLIVEYQDGTNETHPSSFVKKYFVKTIELSAKYAIGDQKKYRGLYSMNMRLLPNVIQKVVINMGNGKIVRSQQLDKFEPLNDFRKRRRRLKCDGMDPRLSEINELWDKRLTISMHIEDKDIRDKNNDGMDCWEFTYQQIESTTMSQYEFDMINTIDEKTRKKLKEGDKGDFFSFFDYNKKRLKSLHPNTD